jgi:hypothetical protein
MPPHCPIPLSSTDSKEFWFLEVASVPFLLCSPCLPHVSLSAPPQNPESGSHRKVTVSMEGLACLLDMFVGEKPAGDSASFCLISVLPWGLPSGLEIGQRPGEWK